MPTPDELGIPSRPERRISQCPACMATNVPCLPWSNADDTWQTACCGTPLTGALWFDRATDLLMEGNTPTTASRDEPQVWRDEFTNSTARRAREILSRPIFTNITESGPSEPDIPFEQEAPPMPTGVPESWWNANPLPDGFRWYTNPTTHIEAGFDMAIISYQGQIEQYGERIAALREWCARLGVQIAFNRYSDWMAGSTYVRFPMRFLLAQTDEETLRSYYEDFVWESEFTCPLCEETHPAYTVACQGRYLACRACNRGIWSTRDNENTEFRVDEREPARTDVPEHIDVPRSVSGVLLCSGCAGPCAAEGCVGWADLTRADAYCAEHAAHTNCGACSNRMESTDLADPEWAVSPRNGPLCRNCVDALCPECDTLSWSELYFSEYFDARVCRACYRRGRAGDGVEEFDNSANVTARALRLPTIPGREDIRKCGIEIEGANGTESGDELAAALYEAGLSAVQNRTGYHHGNGAGFAHVENDSSVDWECVIGPVNMASRNDVQQLNRAIRLIRERVRDGRLSLDLRAGCHIHVDAAQVSLDGAFNLATLFAFIEDVIFRLGAAKWPIHRALQGSDYAQPIPKESRKLAFAQANGDEDGSRYYALSFQNYFGRMLNACRCGASRYDSWEDCTCNLGKCTFEFRVFNTTANPRKLHAYLALAQALVAKALSLGKIEDPANEFPALGFVHRRFKDMGENEQADMIYEWQERLEWMFTELPLTDEERESLAYCIRNSELVHAGEDFINELTGAVSEQPVEEVAA